MPIPSPFHERTQALCTSYRFKDWAGYCAVCSYDTTHEREYFAFRESAGLLDVTPLYKYEVYGPDAAALLARMMVRDVGKLKVGRVGYSCWCDDDGKVIDDGTIARLDEHLLPGHRRRPHPPLAPGALPRPRRDAGGLERAAGGAGAPGTDLARRPRRRQRRRPGRAQVLRRHPGGDRRRAGVDQPHRLHRRPGLRGVGGGRAGAPHLGRPDRRRPPARHRARRPRRPRRGPHRGRLHAAPASTTTARTRWSSSRASRRRWSWASAGWSTSSGATSSAATPSPPKPQRGPAWHLVGLEVSWEELEALYSSFDLPPSAAGDGAARRPAGLRRRRPPGGQGDQPHLVADPQEVPGHRLGRARLRGAGDAGSSSSTPSSSSGARSRATVVATPFFDPERKRKP